MECKAKHTRLDHKLHYSAIIVLFLQFKFLFKQMEENMEIIHMVDITKNIHWLAKDATKFITYYNCIFSCTLKELFKIKIILGFHVCKVLASQWRGFVICLSAVILQQLSTGNWLGLTFKSSSGARQLPESHNIMELGH